MNDDASMRPADIDWTTKNDRPHLDDRMTDRILEGHGEGGLFAVTHKPELAAQHDSVLHDSSPQLLAVRRRVSPAVVNLPSKQSLPRASQSARNRGQPDR